MLCRLLAQPGGAAHSKYVEPVAAMCAFLRRLSTPTRWFELERGLASLHLVYRVSELLAEHVKLGVNIFGQALKFCSVFLIDRATTYAQTLVKNSSATDSITAFIACPNDQIKKPRGTSYSQQNVHSGHKKHFFTH